MKTITDFLVPIAIGIGFGAIWPYFDTIMHEGNKIHKALGMMILAGIVMTGLLGIAIYMMVRF